MGNRMRPVKSDSVDAVRARKPDPAVYRAVDIRRGEREDPAPSPP